MSIRKKRWLIAIAVGVTICLASLYIVGRIARKEGSPGKQSAQFGATQIAAPSKETSPSRLIVKFDRTTLYLLLVK